MEIIEYKTVVSTNIASLDKAVNELIKKGFQPFGPPYIVPKNGCAVDERGAPIDYPVCQPMVSTGESTVPANQAKVEAEVEMAKEAKKAFDQQIAKVLSH